MNQHNQSLYFVAIDKSTDSNINFHKISPPFASIDEAKNFQEQLIKEYPECLIYRQAGVSNAIPHALDDTDQSEPTTPKYGAPETTKALFILFDAAVDHLDKNQLAYIARLNEHAALQAKSLSSVAISLGTICYNTDNSALPLKEGMAELFYNLSHQLDHIGGLIEIADEAAHRLTEKGA